MQRFDIPLENIIVHEGWKPKEVVSNGNDIALIRLPRLAITINEDFNMWVLPICLAWKNTIRLVIFSF